MSTNAAAEHFRHAYTKDKGELLTRLARIEGQVRGIRRLVDEEAYCLDVLQQVDAMTAATDQVALLLVEDHIKGCVAHAIQTGDGEAYTDEVMTVVRRMLGRRGKR
ncbi:MAG: metal-sensitive transcriptional regulator [Chloroflexota bacterium]